MSRMFRSVLFAVLGAALSIGTAQLSFAASVQEIMASVNKNADELQKLKELLNSPDSSIRLAAYKALLNSDDPVQQRLAIETGIMSADAIVQGLVVGKLVAKKKTIVFKLEPDEKTAKGGKDFSTRWGGLITAQVVDYKLDDGTFRLLMDGYGGDGQFSGATYSFRVGPYSGQFSVSDVVLKGMFRCGDTCAVPTSVSLQ